MAVTLGALNGQAQAAPTNDPGANLTKLWTTVLLTPASENPLGGGGPGSGCFDLGGIVAPFGAPGTADCTVKPGTKLFIAGYTVECSTFPEDVPTYREEAAQLPECASSNNPTPPPVTLDGRPLALSAVVTPVNRVVLREGNLFGEPAGSIGQFAAHGWMATVHPLPPGVHTVVVTLPDRTQTTQITVVPGR